MSSDSDEDELLQQALQEQSQRDVNYNKSSGKPVQNFVQQPAKPSPARRKSSQAGSGRKQRQSEDFDDDSEVEMLSISSGDEDSSNNRAVRPPKGGRDDQWDGGEPDCWKRVDEAELGRRVRDMREARIAPVVQMEQKPALRKGLANLQSIPRGIECIDPLGLGLIDNKSLRLVYDRKALSPSKAEKDYPDQNLREKLMYFSEKFDAKLFLSRVHEETSADDLEAGSIALKTDFEGRTSQRKKLVKENFDCFVSCKTTIDDIETKLTRIEEDPEGSGTTHLYNCIQGVSSVANRAFEPLFERQAQTEKIRSVQGMLQRFRTLFNLPSTIRGNISKGEYDLAVREYRKAKSIVLPLHVGILKRVLEEVEKVMQEFKGRLYKSMEDPHIDLTNLENIVRLLLDLEPELDPVWHYLYIQNQRIRGLLEKCTLDHETMMEQLQNEIREKALSDAKWKQLQQDLNDASDGDYGITVEDIEPLMLSSEEVDAHRGKYIRRLTAVLIHHVPTLWKTTLSVFSGKFAKSSQVSGETNVSTSASKIEERDGKFSAHSLEEVAGMIRNTISAYESKVQKTFQDFEEFNILRPYMNDSIMEISKACQAFEAKDSAPSVAVTALRTLQSEITKVYIIRLCSWMRTSTEELAKEESWTPVSVLERNKSPYTISLLPLAFRSILVSAMDQINLMVQSLRNEAKRSEDIFMQLQEIQESARLAFLNCLLDFAGHLERIGGELAQSKSNRGSPQFQNGYSDDQPQMSYDPLPESLIHPLHQLLMVLSNIGYCKDELSRELYNKYKHIWQQSRGKDEEDADKQDLYTSFSGLEEKILAQYTFAKAQLIRAAAENYMLDAGVQWASAPAVKGVRDAAVELLHSLVAVHAEVFAGCKPLLDKTLGILVEGLIDTLLSLFHENQEKDLRALDANGFCQLMLELEYFETILNPYFTHEARESLKSLQGVLLEKATESATESVDTPTNLRRRGGDEHSDERQQGSAVSPDDLIALAQQYSSELLQAELERTRVNTACFIESYPLDSVPEQAKASIRGSMDSPSGSFKSTQNSQGRQRRR
ncbi:Exocyst complex component SEC5 [Heracleum sosnowskyi]|uniref:Exocyst complex component SEC5 n=1 Tax=Heracleum sosnowskyi TaxID=360622 RepID=A0AAD8H836_9APIA|nr:Exocyst complex component SEC5 [Heracleum sosnowskyi]